MNTLDGDHVFFRSLATRGAAASCPSSSPTSSRVLKAAGFDLVIVETPGIGQGDAAIVPFVDVSLYVMTPEFGAASQLEKIDMLDFADVVAINKFERRGAEDACATSAASWCATARRSARRREDMPVFGTSAPRRFNDDGVTALYQHLRGLLAEHGLAVGRGRAAARRRAGTPRRRTPSCPPSRVRYLAEIAETVRGYHADTDEQVDAAAARASTCRRPASWSRRRRTTTRVGRRLDEAPHDARRRVAELLDGWPRRRSRRTPATSWSCASATRSCAPR